MEYIWEIEPVCKGYRKGRRNMQVIKRDGTVVEYDRNKIIVAVRKANIEVDEADRISN